MGSERSGSVVLMLHSHLPFYRKAGMWPFGEENLYECMGETYLPLLNMLNELLDQGIKAKITVGITPILAEQLADAHLQQGFVEYLNVRQKAAEKDIARYPDPKVEHSEHLAFLAKYYFDYYGNLRDEFENRYQRNLIAAFKKLQDAGAIEITTSSATHGFSPLMGNDESIHGQFKVGVETYKKHFGRAPKGYWLPECAYRGPREWPDPATGELVSRPSIDKFLYDEGLKYFFTEYHAIEGGHATDYRRQFGIYGNVEYVPMSHRPKTGLTTYEAYWMKDYPVAVMGRNNRASFQVWSSADGYPGDGLYREFHRKDENSGLHYWRLTSKDADLGEKMLYDPVKAFEQTQFHADHYSKLLEQLLKDYHRETGEHGLILISFDTELFGHWWFEGVEWLKQLISRLHKIDSIEMQTGSEYLESHPPKTAMELPDSTWGHGGHFWVWDNHHTDWMWPVIHDAERDMLALARNYAHESDPQKIRALNQAFRELLLLESSDWPFLVTTFQAKDYAIERFNEHVENFRALSQMVENDQIDAQRLDTIEEKNNPFGLIDYRWFVEEPATSSVTPV